MEIKYRDIVLRDCRPSDIDDELRWNTTETEWALWDAPWEMIGALPTFDAAAFREQRRALLEKPRTEPRRSFELDTADGAHIGRVTSYLVDGRYEWMDGSASPGQTALLALGVDIKESAYWGRGLGAQALAAFAQYHLDSGAPALCLQTWSGNTRMLLCAQRLGFVECERRAGVREVRGARYDALTFLLDTARFASYMRAQGGPYALFYDTDFLRGDALFLRLIKTVGPIEEKRWLPAYHFDICLPDGTAAGRCDLRIGHCRGTYYGGNIGYAIDPPYRGRRLAAQACRLLFALAKKHGMEHLFISCAPENAASRKTCELAGGVLVEIAALPPDTDLYQEGRRYECIYRFAL